MLRTKLAPRAARWNRENQWGGDGAYYCTVKARDVCRKARDVLGGNGITLDFHIMRHLCDMEALITYEGTVEIQSLIVGRHLTGHSAFV